MKALTHNDLDGYTSAHIIAQHTKNFDKENYFVTDYAVGYEEFIEAIKDNEDVYISDVSFTDETYHYLQKIMEKTNNIHWFDHHDSSLALSEKYPEIKKLNGIRSKEYCGSMLTYMGLNSSEYNDAPLFYKHVDDFDCWKFEMDNTLEFKYGTEIFPLSFDSEVFEYIDDVDSVIEQGKTISKYVDIKNVITREKLLFPYIWTVNDTNYNCVVCNQGGGSLIFGDLINENDVAITFQYNGKKWVYGLYSAQENIDVSIIAELFGGGGHKGASGFSYDKFLFEDKSKITWGMWGEKNGVWK